MRFQRSTPGSRACSLSLTMLLASLGACHQGNSEVPQDPARVLAELRRGRFAEVLVAARKGQDETRSRPNPELFAEFGLLEAEALLGTGGSEPARAILTSLRIANPAQELRRQVDLANAGLKIGDLKGASSILDGVIKQAKPGAAPPEILEAVILRGRVHWSSGKPGAAEAVWREADQQARRASDPYHQGMAVNNLAGVFFEQHHWDQAKDYYERAQASLQQAGAPYARSIALSTLAMCHLELGDLDKALGIQSQAIEIQKTGSQSALAVSYGHMGSIYGARGESWKAIFYYSQALDLATKLKDADLAATQAVNLANIYLKLGDRQNAEKNNEIARQRQRDSLYVKFNAAAIAVLKGDAATARRMFQELADLATAPPPLRWGSYQALAKLSLASKDYKESNRYFEAALSVITGARSEIKKGADSIAFLTEPIEVYRDYVQSLLAQDLPAQALAVADSSRALGLRAAAPNAKARPAFQATAQASGAVLLSYWLWPKGSYAWVVTRHGIMGCPLPENGDTIRNWVAAYRQEIEQGGKPADNPKSMGNKLFQALIAPVQSKIASDSQVIVVPDGAIHGLNLETLPTPDHQYWIRKVTLSIAPSLGLLAAAPFGGAGAGGLLIVGDAEAAGAFRKLEAAAAEIKSIQARFPKPAPTALVGQQANVAGYHQSHPERFRLIHFATHAEANTESPLESAVILSPGANGYKLYARDIYDPKAPLRANLVTISACQSAGAKSYSGEGLIGFAWAFLHAGARNVIAGLWDADDRSTLELMDRLYAGLEHGKTPPVALRAAKLALLDSPGAWRKPFNWGPFQVYRRSAR